MKYLIQNRTDLVRILASLFLMIGIIMSFKLWITDRTFPLSPISDIVPQSPIGFDFVVVISLLIMLALGIVFRYRIIFIIILMIMLLLFMQDQMRWQPWVYIYVMLLFPFSFKVNKSDILTYFQILMIGVYLWGGIHKFSSEFIDITYNMILIDMFGIEDNETILNLGWLGYLIPVTEVMIAVFLVIPKTRLLGIIGVIITHVFIFILLINIESNTVLYPWNLAMVLFVVVLFFRNPNRLKIWSGHTWQLKFLNAKAVILFLMLPALSIFNMWDSYLSFKLFSGSTHLFYICIEKEDVNRLNTDLHQYFWKSEGLTRGEMISLNAWSVDELNVPFYPETRVFKQVAESFCKSGEYDDLLIFAEFDRGFKEINFGSFRCSDL